MGACARVPVREKATGTKIREHECPFRACAHRAESCGAGGGSLSVEGAYLFCKRPLTALSSVVMPTQRLSSLLTQRDALLERIEVARGKPTGHLIVPTMVIALEALDDVIAREKDAIQAAGHPLPDGL